MYKSIVSTCLLLFSPAIFCLFESSGSLAATPGIDSLKKNAIESFLQTANNPKTPLHQKLGELNQIDGRNPHGIFPKTLTKKDIQIIPIDGADQFGSYCHRLDGKLDRFQCSQGATETYMILISAKTGVHKATEYQRFIFIVRAVKNIEWKRDENDREYDRRESISISQPTPVSIEKLIPDLQ